MWHRGPVSEGFWKPKGTACPNRLGKAVTYAGKAQQNHGVGDGGMGASGSIGPGWACMPNSRTPPGFKPKGLPIRLQTWCPNFTFETAKNKAKPWNGGVWDGSFRLGWIGFQGLGKQNHGVEDKSIRRI